MIDDADLIWPCLSMSECRSLANNIASCTLQSVIMAAFCFVHDFSGKYLFEETTESGGLLYDVDLYFSFSVFCPVIKLKAVNTLI